MYKGKGSKGGLGNGGVMSLTHVSVSKTNKTLNKEGGRKEQKK